MTHNAQPPKTRTDAWWSAPLCATEASQHAPGLSLAQAQQQLAKCGPNVFTRDTRHTLLRQFLSRFKNPLVLVLLLASSVSAMTGEVTNFAIISGIVLLSVTLDFVQEFRANAAADKLRQSVAVRAKVRRDGHIVEIPVAEVVPGDVAVLQAGDLIPADAVVLQARDFFVNQSLLTGEAFPVEKHAAREGVSATDMQDATYAVFMGTSVIGGSATVQVMRTGSATAMGEIANSIQKPAHASSFERGTRRFGMLIMWLTVVMVLFVLLVNAWFHRPWLESFLFAVALAVGLTPELLPMVVSVTLARGAIRLAELQMIVKRQTAIQDLGSMDVLCTDKTGTLTQAKIELACSVDPQGQDSPHVLTLAYLNSYFETGLKSPLDEAILATAPQDVSAWTKVDEIPFDFERRCVSVLIDDGDKRWLVVKGAAEEMVRLCTAVEDGHAPRPLLDADLHNIQARYHALETEGLRVLGIAWREVPRDHAHAMVNDESELVLAGFVAFIDPPQSQRSQRTGSVATSRRDHQGRHRGQRLGHTSRVRAARYCRGGRAHGQRD